MSCGHQTHEEMEAREVARWEEVKTRQADEIRNAETDEQAFDHVIGIVGAWTSPRDCPWAVDAYKERMGWKSSN